MTLCRRAGWIALAIATLASTPAIADDTDPPATLIAGKPVHGTALDLVFANFKLDRMSATFAEEKTIALLAKPLTSTGTIYFDRDKGIAKLTLTPRKQAAVLTATSLKIRKGKRTEDIPLAKSKDLKALVLVFPTLLRGEREQLEGAFTIGMYGSEDAWWALELAPKSASLRKLVRKVVVFGNKSAVVALEITEASGDVTRTRLTAILKNGDVPDAEIATAFGAP